MAALLGLSGCGNPTGLQLLNQAKETYSQVRDYQEEAQVAFLQEGPKAIRSEVLFGRGLGSVATITFPSQQRLSIYGTSRGLYLINPGDRSVIAAAPEELPAEAASLGSLLREIPAGAKLRYAGALDWRGQKLERVEVLSADFRGEIDFATVDKLPRLVIIRDGRGEPILRQEVTGLIINRPLPRNVFRFRRPVGYSFRWLPRPGRQVDSPRVGD